jgi:23S rRNA (cytidine1920-2'-O)/16S rRNA (cytidine1409-2'-O)-methyltransferase
VDSREQARALILAGQVRVAGQPADKPGRLVGPEQTIEVLGEPPPFVGRGGLKLARALLAFDINVNGKTAVDVGASTGGFTDCLLQNGAKKVFAVDVGYGQLDWKLQSDPRVTCLDRKNARYLTPADLGETVDLAVIDVSFISLKLILPAVIPLLKPGGGIVALVKPQFEVGKQEVEHKGIIKDLEKHWKVLLDLRAFIAGTGWVLCQAACSPITGQKGNREYLIHLVEGGAGAAVSDETLSSLVGVPD